MKRERDDAPDASDARQAVPRDINNKRARSNYDQRRGGDQRPQTQRQPNGGRGSTRDGSGNGNGAVEVRTLKTEREQDPHRLAQRQKQIDYGKNTLGYDRYCAMVPKHQRRKGEHPMTPDKTLSVGKKHFDIMIRRWRQALHDYDPPELVERLRAAEQEAAKATATAEATPASANGTTTTEDADLDPELADLDPSKQSATGSVPSIYDAFNEDDGTAVDFEDDDDDDLL